MAQKFYGDQKNVMMVLSGKTDMKEIDACSVDAAKEKHIPVCERDGNHIKVTVGSIEHPMLQEHYIEWIAIETTNGIQVKYLKPENPPKACFALTEGEEVIALYEHCNIHGLWKAELNA